MSYDHRAEADKLLDNMLKNAGVAPSSVFKEHIAKALMIARAEGFCDAVQCLRDHELHGAADHLLTKMEAVWCGQ